MTSADRLAEMAAEIERASARRVEAYNEGYKHGTQRCAEENQDLIERLRARIAELEGHAAVTFGTLEQPTPDWPTRIEHNIPPSAPPHDE